MAIADEASKPAYYIAVEPPSSLLDDAGVGKYIGDVKVLAQDDSHTYDAKDNKFTPIPSPTEKKLAEG